MYNNLNINLFNVLRYPFKTKYQLNMCISKNTIKEKKLNVNEIFLTRTCESNKCFRAAYAFLASVKPSPNFISATISASFFDKSNSLCWLNFNSSISLSENDMIKIIRAGSLLCLEHPSPHLLSIKD